MRSQEMVYATDHQLGTDYAAIRANHTQKFIEVTETYAAVINPKLKAITVGTLTPIGDPHDVGKVVYAIPDGNKDTEAKFVVGSHNLTGPTVVSRKELDLMGDLR